MRPWLSLFVLAALTVPVAAAAAPPESLGVTPPDVTLVDALPGQSYERTVQLQNQFDTPTTLTLAPDGEVGEWLDLDETTVVVPPRETHDLLLHLRVPGDAYVGRHDGLLQVTAEPKERPQGTGFALRHAVAVTLRVDVGGEPRPALAWVSTAVEDVEEGTPACADVAVRNEGNVRSGWRTVVEVVPLAGGAVVASGAAPGEGLPGSVARSCVALEPPLAIGQYVASVRVVPLDEGTPLAVDPGADVPVPFKVVPVGTLGKEGALRMIEHEPWVAAGMPLKIEAVFENTGRATIAKAVFLGELRRDGVLVAALESLPRVVPPGETVRLATIVTVAEPGAHDIEGRVVYDGYETPASTSVVNAQAAPPAEGNGFPAWLVVAAVVATLAGAVALARRGR